MVIATSNEKCRDLYVVSLYPHLMYVSVFVHMFDLLKTHKECDSPVYSRQKGQS